MGEGAVSSDLRAQDAGRHIIRAGLIGIDIQSSRSPAMHMREAAAQGIALHYELFDLAGSRDPTALASTLDAAERSGFAGVNVTHPFKQRVMGLLDRVSEDARAIGAVNTVIFGPDGRVGYNTDSAGFAEGFERQLPAADVERVVLIGAGGAGAATAMAMVNLGCRELVIVDAQQDRAEQLIARLPGAVARAGGSLPEEIAQASGLINATPIGMEGHPGTPIDTALLRPGHWVADVVYFPLETELLRAARAVGCRTAHGGDMAVFQAAGAFELFTGHRADRTRMMANF